MSALAHHRGGAGEPLLLIHGVGSQWQIWTALLPALEAEREVVAVDLPGFGASAPLPAGVEPSAWALAEAVAGFLDELGWERPHVAGNSLGGWVAFELAKLGRARSVTALSPAGLRTPGEARFARMSLLGGHALARAFRPALPRLFSLRPIRYASLWQVFGHPSRVPEEEALRATRNFGDSPSFRATASVTTRERFTGGDRVRVPATVGWGELDRLLPPRQAPRWQREVPGLRLVMLPGCGHSPMWDDPPRVARLLLEGSTAR